MGKVTELLFHPDELLAAVRLLKFRHKFHERDPQKMEPSLKRCYELLFLTSRSFASVIEELHPELRDVVALFYLFLRALDTVEDDMSIDPKVKVPWLRNFDKLLDLEEYSYHEVNKAEKDREVLVDFTVLLTEFHKFKPQYQDVIRDISKRMGHGMAKYVLDDQFNTDGVETLADFDEYCHYVAGIVGEGLTRLFVLAGFADDSLLDFEKANSMGLFLQKTNIIRDFNEDLNDGRAFYPKETWSKYTDELPNFDKVKTKEMEIKGVTCVNELVLNSLQHVPDVLGYLVRVLDPSSFNFCAIPQVMAIATLDLVFNNPRVLHEHVKIRRGTTCKLILKSRTFPEVVQIFRYYIRRIKHKVPITDPNYFKIGAQCGKIEQLCDKLYPDESTIPKGVTYKNEFTDVMQTRAAIDVNVQETINAEFYEFVYVLGGALIVVIGALLVYLR